MQVTKILYREIKEYENICLAVKYFDYFDIILSICIFLDSFKK